MSFLVDGALKRSTTKTIKFVANKMEQAESVVNQMDRYFVRQKNQMEYEKVISNLKSLSTALSGVRKELETIVENPAPFFRQSQVLSLVDVLFREVHFLSKAAYNQQRNMLGLPKEESQQFVKKWGEFMDLD